MQTQTTWPETVVGFSKMDVIDRYEDRIDIHDNYVGLRAITIVHSTLKGPAFGGIRRFAYPDESAMVADVRRLAAAMTLKCSAARLPAGGAKTVIWDRPGFDHDAGYRELGRKLRSLNGRYICGPDIGTSERSLQLIREETPFVSPSLNNPAESTARGVLSGLRGLLRVLDNDERLVGRRYAVEGLGAVGLGIAKGLVEQGAEVVGWDLDPAARQMAAQSGVDVLSADDWTRGRVSCDIYMPCAVGGRLSPQSVPNLSCRAICGAANNQLSSPHVANLLRSRNILYAPDFIVNVGAVIEGVWTVGEGDSSKTRARIEGDIAAIADTCESVLRRAILDNISTHDAALQLAISRLEESSPH